MDEIVRSGIAKGMGAIQAAHPDQGIIQGMMQMLSNDQMDEIVRSGIAKGMGAIQAAHPDQGIIQGMMQMLSNDQMDEIVCEGIAKGMVAIQAAHPDQGIIQGMMQMLSNDQMDDWVRSGIAKGMGAIQAAHPDQGIIQGMMQMLSNDQMDEMVRRGIAEGIGTIVKTRSNPQIDNDMRAGESRSPERRQGDRSGEGSSSQGGQLLDQVEKVLDEYSQTKEREKKLKQEVQKLQQEHNRTQEQLAKTQQERDQARGQLREAQQEHNRTQEQLRDAREERDQARRQLREAEGMRQSLQGEETRRRAMWNRLYDAIWSLTNNTEREPRQDGRGQSSRGELRANDALPTTVEGMQEQLGGERRRQQELFERVLQLQEGIQRTLRERGEDVPSNQRLNELLRQGIWNVVSYHRLDEMLFPRQEHGELPSLRQRVRNFYLQTVSESTSLGLPQGQIAGEFVDQLQEQMEAHNRPSQEWIDTAEDIQEEVTGRRPDRTRH
jgi:hypothetical protein